MGDLRNVLIERIKLHIPIQPSDSWSPDELAIVLADDLLALPDVAGLSQLDPNPLHVRIFTALGAIRDHMPPEDVAAVQRFADALRKLDEANAETVSP